MPLQLPHWLYDHPVGTIDVPDGDAGIFACSLSSEQILTIIREKHRLYLCLTRAQKVFNLFVCLRGVHNNHTPSRVSFYTFIYFLNYAMSPVILLIVIY